jgi:hypothetical protein
MSIQGIRSNSDQPMLEQLWYTWSAVGLGPLSAGFRIRAASRELSDARNPRVQALDRYLRYVLPAGTDPFAITPNMAPICLSLIQPEQGEWILVNKTYTGKDGVGRPGAFFVHLLCNFPPDFSAAQAISLWRSSFLRSSDIDQSSGAQLSGVQLDSIPFGDLKHWPSRDFNIMYPMGISSSWLYDCFPLVIRAYLMWRKRWEQWTQQQPQGAQSQIMHQAEPPKLYIAAPSDMVAAFIFGITRCLPQQLLTDLTFSTYEYDVRSKGQVLFVGTALAPTPDGQITTNQDLPAACYQDGVAINCYNYDESKTQLEHDLLAISFAEYATECLMTDNFLELDWLFSDKTAHNLNLNVSRFLQTYDSYIVKAQNPTQKDVEFYLDNADAEMLFKVHVQDLITRLSMSDTQWLNNFLMPRLASLLKHSKVKPRLANALEQLAKLASQKAADAIDTDDITAFDAMLSVVQQIASSTSEAWRIQPHIFGEMPTIQSFLTKHPNARFQFIEQWNQLTPPLGIDEVRPFLNVPEQYFEAFYSRDLRPEWKYIATEALIASAIAHEAVPVLGQKYQRPVEDLMQYLSQNSWHKAQTLFEQLAERNYPDKLVLLPILLDSSTSLAEEEIEILLKRAHLKSDEYESFLIHYGSRYLLSPLREALVLKPFKTLAMNAPNRKMRVLDSWLNSESLARWFEAQSTGPGNLDEVLQTAVLAPSESNIFIERYGKHYLERYYQQSPAYQPSPLILDYLKRYVDSLIPKSLWQPLSTAREFISFLRNSPLSQSLSKREQQKVRQWYSFWEFLQQPSAKIADIRTLGRILLELRFDGDLPMIERLAKAFAACIKSATELASVTYIMSTLITEAELIQMLYTMAEYIRDSMVDRNTLVRQSAKALLEPYVQLALCFNSVCDLTSEQKKMAIDVAGIQPVMKEKLFLHTFLYILLQNAPQNIIDSFNMRANESDLAYWKKWEDYKPLRNSAPAGEFPDSSSEYKQPSRLRQSRGQAHNNLDAFLTQPSTSRKEIEANRNMLSDRLMRDPTFVENLAGAFVSCVESETELTSVILMLSPFITKTNLLQMLYAMAEITRDKLSHPEKKQSAEYLLEPYIRFVLCFESVFESSGDERILFVRTFLNLLLQSADDMIFQRLDTRNWPDKLSQKWQDYMPRHFAMYTMHQNDLWKRESSSTMPALSPRNQEASTGSLPRFSRWFTRLKEWLAEDAFLGSASGPTTLERQKKGDKQT